MIVRNTTGLFKKINGEIVRPYRKVEVPDNYILQENEEMVLESGEEIEDKSLDEMSKDELLDYTAINGIIADYSMTKKQIKKLIKENEDK